MALFTVTVKESEKETHSPCCVPYCACRVAFFKPIQRDEDDGNRHLKSYIIAAVRSHLVLTITLALSHSTVERVIAALKCYVVVFCTYMNSI